MSSIQSSDRSWLTNGWSSSSSSSTAACCFKFLRRLQSTLVCAAPQATWKLIDLTEVNTVNEPNPAVQHYVIIMTSHLLHHFLTSHVAQFCVESRYVPLFPVCCHCFISSSLLLFPCLSFMLLHLFLLLPVDTASCSLPAFFYTVPVLASASVTAM